MNQKIINTFKYFSLAIIVLFGVVYVYAETIFKEPTAVAPGNNMEVPVHTEQGGQTKNGALSVDAFIANMQAWFGQDVFFQGSLFGGTVGSASTFKIGSGPDIVSTVISGKASTSGILQSDSFIKNQTNRAVCADAGGKLFLCNEISNAPALIYGTVADLSKSVAWDLGYQPSNKKVYRAPLLLDLTLVKPAPGEITFNWGYCFKHSPPIGKDPNFKYYAGKCEGFPADFTSTTGPLPYINANADAGRDASRGRAIIPSGKVTYKGIVDDPDPNWGPPQELFNGDKYKGTLAEGYVEKIIIYNVKAPAGYKLDFKASGAASIQIYQ